MSVFFVSKEKAVSLCYSKCTVIAPSSQEGGVHALGRLDHTPGHPCRDSDTGRAQLFLVCKNTLLKLVHTGEKAPML